MDISIRIAFLESRLHRLSTRKGRDNAGVCRKISREIRNLKKKDSPKTLLRKTKPWQTREAMQPESASLPLFLCLCNPAVCAAHSPQGQ